MRPSASATQLGIGPGSSGENQLTIAALLSETAACLRQAGIENPGREARVLLCHASGLDQSTIIGHPERRLPDTVETSLRRLVARRSIGEPLSRILGEREFWSLSFRLSEDTLDPRPDSETLIEAVIGQISDRHQPVRILDLGTGTGCLLLALLSELPRAYGIGVDASEGACAVAAVNAASLGLAARAGFIASDWASAVAGPFDLVISNPPYIPLQEISGLAPEVREHDPHAALCGGDDGLDAYRRLAPEMTRLLKPEGLAALEIGAGQREEVTALLGAAGLAVQSVHADLAGIDRCLLVTVENPRLGSEKGFQKAGRTTTVV